MKYFAMIDGERRGPFELERLAEAGVRPSTYVWRKGMPDWEKAEDDPEICRMFRRRIHDLMHPGSVEAERRNALQPIEPQPPVERQSTGISRLPGGQELPTIDEIEERRDIEQPPSNVLPWALLVTILCFPLTGVFAIIFSLRSRKTWKEGDKKLAHDYCQAAKLWTGVSFFLGLILYSFLFRYL